jgi:hypothetical protein
MGKQNLDMINRAVGKLYKLAQTSNGGSLEANEKFSAPLDGEEKQSEHLKPRGEKPPLKRL